MARTLYVAALYLTPCFIHWGLFEADNSKGPACIPSNISAYDADFPEKLIEKYGVTDAGRRLLSSITAPGIKVSEDCLSLNIWTKPQTGERKKAVLVWIHGGSYVSGTRLTWP